MRIGAFRVVAPVTVDIGRAEYLVIPREGNDSIEYRAIVYDTCVLPDEQTGVYVEGTDAYIVSKEWQFLREIKSEVFPMIVASGQCYGLDWIVVRIKTAYTIQEYVRDNGALPVEKALKVSIKLCSIIETIHSYENGALHLNLTPDNVRIWVESDEPILLVEGLGFLSELREDKVFNRAITPMSYYLAPELFVGYCFKKTDVYSLCLIIYMLLTGKDYPWDRDPDLYDSVKNGDCDKGNFFSKMGSMWNTRPDLSKVLNPHLRNIIEKGIATGPSIRTGNVSELKKELKSVLNNAKKKEGQKADNGFAAVAGLSDFKEEMLRKFILPIRHKKLAKSYGITPPNGCLLYGPPGCGKTFVVNKLAEEAGIKCRIFRPSDIASIYVHGGQERIRNLFDQVKDQAPIMVCFDEADAFVAVRSLGENEHYSMEVNEFLTHLHEAAKEGVYVFLMTNFPEKIDPAILRTGRIDEKYFIPLPDITARYEFFEIRLQNIKTSGKIDYHRLAMLTEGMTFSDLDYIITESCRITFYKAVESKSNRVIPVSQNIIEDVVAAAPRSVSAADRKRYEKVEKLLSGKEPEQRKIGFV